MKKNLLVLIFLTLSFFSFAEIKPWVMVLEGSNNNVTGEPMLNTSMWGRYYTGSKSEIGFMHKVWDFTDSKDNNASTFFFNTPRHEEHQIVYYFNKKNDRHYAAIIEPETNSAIALEFTEKQKALNVVYVWSYLKYIGDEKVKDYKVNYLPVYGEAITVGYIDYPADYIKDFYASDQSDVNSSVKLKVIKDSEEIYNKIKTNGYYICESCTKINHGWSYVEVAGEHCEFDNTAKKSWKKEIARIHKVVALNKKYSTFKTDY